MQKSGTAYIYNILNDLLINSGNADAREIKRKYGLEKQMRLYNNNVGLMKRKTLLKLILISLIERAFVVKTHRGPTRLLNFLSKFGLIKTIYIYRDPRDVLLSAIDHGKRIIARGDDHTFAQMVDFYTALRNVKKWTGIWQIYNKDATVLCIKYEDLRLRPFQVLNKIMGYLNIHVNRNKVEEILFMYNKENKNANMRGLHYNKAKINRHKAEFSEKQMIEFSNELGDEITAMGYSNGI